MKDISKAFELLISKGEGPYKALAIIRVDGKVKIITKKGR